MQESRDYRLLFGGDLQQHSLVVGETDLAICLPPGLWNDALCRELTAHLVRLRGQLQRYIAEYPEFAATHQPYPAELSAPPIVKALCKAGKSAKTGPMAAVAGYFAAAAGEWLQQQGAAEIIVENGGDIYLRSQQDRTVGIYAGAKNPFTGKIGVLLPKADLPWGICTSSGTIGKSFSYGIADAATVVAHDAALADAVATAAGNLVKGPADVAAGAEFACTIPGIYGALLICGDQLAAAGQIQLTRL